MKGEPDGDVLNPRWSGHEPDPYVQLQRSGGGGVADTQRLLTSVKRTRHQPRHRRRFGLTMSDFRLSASTPVSSSTPPPPATRPGFDIMKFPLPLAKCSARNLGGILFWSSVPGWGGREKAFVMGPDKEILGARGGPICLVTSRDAIIDSHFSTRRRPHVALRPTVRVPCCRDVGETWFSAGCGLETGVTQS